MYSGKPYSALVFGASGGIGGAIVETLEDDERCERLVSLSRREDGVDVTDEKTVAAASERLSDEDDFDLVINAAGALDIDGKGPEKAFKDVDPAIMLRAFEINAVGGALFLKHFLPRLAEDRRAVFATLSARVGSIGDNRLGGWMSYRASKSALNQIVRCASVEARRKNDKAIVIALHPGTIETPLTEKYAGGNYTASPEEAALNLLKVCASRSTQHNGDFFDYAGRAVPW